MRILLVEDDDLLADGVVAGLKQHQYTVDRVSDGQMAINVILNEQFDVIILDLGLPKRSGMDVLKTIRKKNITTPVIILTAYDGVSDRVKGLDGGADDYLTKPFDLDELCARIRTLQRRSTARANPTIVYKDIELDPASYSVKQNNKSVVMSRREFALLHMLLSNVGKALTRDHLAHNLYGWGDDVDSNAIEVHIHNLRKKFGSDLITTIRGVGYMIPALED
ncbi:MAG: response regulator transcription factor [Gammaproteobacteria bacterium]|nr:response regulator transcription factor [Gammaproteobacteria bacterium]